ncbi:hypothetical protein LNQ03_31250 [Klebsiella pneumoniae subsp. pneumoniae]|nr:hypothetical protein [Klebsiella pneumoniae subsp. pneumoniae]
MGRQRRRGGSSPLLRALTTESPVMDDGKHAPHPTGRITAPMGAVARAAGGAPTGPSDQPAAQQSWLPARWPATLF